MLKAKNTLLFFIKSSFFFFFVSLYPINRLIRLSKYPVSTKILSSHLVIITITSIVVNILIIKVVANPFILLSPKINKIIATRRVVIFESTIVIIEFLLPFLKAVFKFFRTSNSSFIRAKLITFESTAIPIPSRIPAIPGSVNTPPINQNIENVIIVYKTIPTDAINPENLYKAINNNIIATIPTIPAVNVLFNEFVPKLAATVLDDISSNLVDKLPELINSTKVFTSSCVKLP